ncbi:hypothetical protein [Sphingomonas prati]|uniref:Uncharacterized protein n=1 Tax=Sphingomonas prati TaxID=1843237 RepID=A0A7W9F296_9SPHN|nr:hypothetical protein [Sphingomonas prati]MBB5728569.1 hypothetical protein [Sphingomonas prati]GGE72745.1 hypothetical protein GCM10011404_01590 [Sphingomonas prati]
MTDRQDKAEAARVRRRWVTMGEVLAVAAVTISGLTLWNSYTERQDVRVEKAGEVAKASVANRTLLLKATADRSAATLDMTPLNAEQSIQSQTIAFPSALGVAAVDTTGDARIEAGWFDDALVRARKSAGLQAETRGDERLPVLLTTRYLAEGVAMTDRAIYDIGYATDTAFLQGTDVRLRGLSLVARVKGDDGVKRVDALWARKAR